MSSDKITKETLLKIFSGVPKEQLEGAIRKAEALSKNPEIKNSFSKISDAKIKSLLSALTDGDKRKITDTLTNSDNEEIAELLKKLKGNIR